MLKKNRPSSYLTHPSKSIIVLSGFSELNWGFMYQLYLWDSLYRNRWWTYDLAYDSLRLQLALTEPPITIELLEAVIWKGWNRSLPARYGPDSVNNKINREPDIKSAVRQWRKIQISDTHTRYEKNDLQIHNKKKIK